MATQQDIQKVYHLVGLTYFPISLLCFLAGFVTNSLVFVICGITFLILGGVFVYVSKTMQKQLAKEVNLNNENS
jgi:uncharacterized protein YneF (UPF0154 family)